MDCSQALTVGNTIMFDISKSDSLSTASFVGKACGGTFTAGETLTATTNAPGQHLMELTGGATFTGGKCDGLRIDNANSATVSTTGAGAGATIALFLFDTFSIAPKFETGGSSAKVERHVAPEPLADTSASPSPNASTIVGTELTHSLDDGPAFVVCISAANLPLAGRLTACIINDGSCPNTISRPYLSTAVGGTGLYRIPAGNSTIDPCAFYRAAASTRAGRRVWRDSRRVGRDSMTADDGLRKGARQVFEVALEEPFIEGKVGDADVKYEYSFPYGQTNVNEDTAGGDPVEEAAKRGGVPLRLLGAGSVQTKQALRESVENQSLLP
ncbi:hypothetical protein Ctob_014900 [Chrysochromulina tobinii]|uniref:Uncharacterized protein n=1 Tax=Chrysochromulina tobinii TaxID=1460289 RepID=A0A0M0LS49_9EUKA|nr:hypothetical protein Ctob_014900 [Chrysochromulina tobinii]|eukprot:KOO53874.1 hypothetical protein Ctob_014900 [Chrysochromulina sp. CCMP291]